MSEGKSETTSPTYVERLDLNEGQVEMNKESLNRKFSGKLNPITARTPLEQASEASDLAQKFFAAGDLVGGVAAIQLAAQLVQLARIQKDWKISR